MSNTDQTCPLCGADTTVPHTTDGLDCRLQQLLAARDRIDEMAEADAATEERMRLMQARAEKAEAVLAAIDRFLVTPDSRLIVFITNDADLGRDRLGLEVIQGGNIVITVYRPSLAACLAAAEEAVAKEQA
jgi:hypothetical protein